MKSRWKYRSGRFVRDYIYLGFNQDAAGRIVFEGMMAHVGGARRMATNVRSGQPGRNARHPQDPAWQADEFPFTYAVLDDQLSGRRDGLLQSVLPPREIGRYEVFVPRLDADGIAIAGIHQLPVLVPRATYTGWNPRAPGFGPTALYPLQGTMLPFAATEAERRANGDPRRRSRNDTAMMPATSACSTWERPCSNPSGCY